MSSIQTDPLKSEDKTALISPPTTRNRSKLDAVTSSASPANLKPMQRFDKCKILGKDNKVFYIKLNKTQKTEEVEEESAQENSTEQSSQESFTVTNDSLIETAQKAASVSPPKNAQIRRSLRSSGLKKESIVIKRGKSMVQLSPEMKKKCEELMSSKSKVVKYSPGETSKDDNQSSEKVSSETKKESCLREFLTGAKSAVTDKIRATQKSLTKTVVTPKIVSTPIKLKSPVKAVGSNFRYRITPKKAVYNTPLTKNSPPLTTTPKVLSTSSKLMSMSASFDDSSKTLVKPQQTSRSVTDKVHSNLITSPSKSIEPFRDAAEMDQMLDDVGTSHDIDELIQTFYLPKIPGATATTANPSICHADDEEALGPREKIIAEKRAKVKANNQIFMMRTLEMKKKLSKIQAYLMSQHVSNEIGAVINKNITACRKRDVSRHADMPRESVQTIHKVYAHRIEEVARRQQETRLYKPRTELAHVSPMSENLKKGEPIFVNRKKRFLTKLSPGDAVKIRETSGLLEHAMKQVRQAVDSDATESSTDESADEPDYNNTRQQKLPLHRRAAWRWAHDRAAIGNRWQYLQLQIVDLDHRIRYYENKRTELRQNKGAIVLEGPSNTIDDFENEEDHGNSARTRPLQLSTFKKRKLVQTNGLHMISGKVARPTSTKCGCKWPLQPCILCTGRVNPMEPYNPRFTLSRLEQIAQLDKCFHPVLSLPNDIPLTLYLEKRFGDPDWQAKADKISLETPNDSSTKVMIRGSSKLPKGVNYVVIPKHDKSTMGHHSHSVKRRDIQSKLARNVRSKKSKNRRPMHLKHSKSQDLGQSSSGWHDGLHPNGSYSRMGGNSSPPTSHSRRFSTLYDKRHRNSFDIDNIVIPYSAATQRVEILRCKEITTPKWREITGDDISYDEQANVEDTSFVINEDRSDEAISARHEIRFLEERKKFQSNLKLPWGMRPRANRRTDSRTGSSGANTSGPTSPALNTPPIDSVIDTVVDIDKPDTPSALLDLQPPTPTNSEDLPVGNEAASEAAGPSNVQGMDEMEIQRLRRRRTVSSRLDRDLLSLSLEARLSTLTDSYVQPHESLQFPLTDSDFEAMLQLMPSDLDCETEDNEAEGDGAKTIETSTADTESIPMTIDADGRMDVDEQDYGAIDGDDGEMDTTVLTATASDADIDYVIPAVLQESDSEFEAANEDPKDPEWNGCE